MCHENTMGHCEKLAVKRLGHSYFLADFIAYAFVLVTVLNAIFLGGKYLNESCNHAHFWYCH